MRYLVLFFLCLATLIAYVQRSAMNGATKTIESDLHITTEDLGWVMSGWYLLYTLFQLPGGWLADRLGSKSALIFFAVLWSVLTGLAGLASTWLELLLIWSLMGAAQAGIFPCCTKAIGATFPRSRQAIASGMLAFCMAGGAALAPLMNGILLGSLPWERIFLLYALPGIVWAIVFAWAVPRPDVPSATRQPDPADDWHALPAPATRPSWRRLATDGQMRLLCFQQFLRAGAMVFFYTWFARFLEATKNLSTREAGTLAFWPPCAGAIGGLTGGLISDWLLHRTGNPRLARQGMTFAFLLGCTLSAGTAYFVEDPTVAVMLISAGTFCGMASGVSAYALAIAYGGKRVATVFATMNMSGNFGATLFPAVVGVIVDQTGNWNYALLLFVVMFGSAAVCWLFLNPKGTLFPEESE
jgi:MFS family permease